MRVITVVESRSMLGSFAVSYRDGSGEARFAGDHFGAEAAAAKAMELAIDADRYVIFGSKALLDCIPEELRSK